MESEITLNGQTRSKEFEYRVPTANTNRVLFSAAQMHLGTPKRINAFLIRVNPRNPRLKSFLLSAKPRREIPWLPIFCLCKQ